MARLKARYLAVVDTNVWIRYFRTGNLDGVNGQVFSLWFLEKVLQLLVSPVVVQEYLDILERNLGMDEGHLLRWRARFETDSRCTLIRPVQRYHECRDPDDNMWLDLAHAGRAEYLITNDRDLLDLPADFQKRLPFSIVTPAQFLRAMKAN
jgi:putative PIN family toxin of toxin-antitoxin system